jgi:flagellar biosynthesis/type III secretory pathway M-ring protein FliF/YscJ
MESIERAFTHWRDLFRSMTPGSRRMAGLLAAAVVLGLVYMAVQPGPRPDVDLLHGIHVAAAQLPPMEAALAKANLTDYEIRGTVIFVPHGRESAYMAALEQEKVLTPRFGEQMNKVGTASSPFASKAERDLQIKIATQNELALQICAMPGIEQASVLYSVDIPGNFQPKVFTATVSVKPSGTGQLDESRVLDIRHLVAGAIAGLKPENVTVSDLNSRTWHGDWQKQGPDGTRSIAQVPLPAGSSHRPADESTSPRPAPEPTAASLTQDAWHWIVQSWPTWAAVAAALIVLLMLQRMVRTKTAPADADRDNAAAGRQGNVPPPHWRRQTQAAGLPLHQELSDLVHQDPETAAGILRHWIGQGS